MPKVVGEIDSERNDLDRIDRFGSSRVDLNDLLNKKKEEEKSNKKINLIIFSGALSVALIIVVILNL
tara:strand:- start:261 stop:461 length:201 start_codon:yes stop_codon:yes gene_type:complete